MKNNLSNFFVFAAGVAIGSAVTYKFVKDKYERVVQEEANAYRDALTRRERDVKDETNDAEPEPEAEEGPEEEEFDVYRDKLKKLGYHPYSDVEVDRPKEVSEVSVFEIIDPDDFGGGGDYSMAYLNYFADGVLADDQDIVIEDVDAVIGKDSLSHFGDYEPDAVHVRDTVNKIDYEILRDLRNYSEVANNSPHLAEDE